MCSSRVDRGDQARAAKLAAQSIMKKPGDAAVRATPTFRMVFEAAVARRLD